MLIEAELDDVHTQRLTHDYNNAYRNPCQRGVGDDN